MLCSHQAILQKQGSLNFEWLLTNTSLCDAPPPPAAAEPSLDPSLSFLDTPPSVFPNCAFSAEVCPTWMMESFTDVTAASSPTLSTPTLDCEAFDWAVRCTPPLTSKRRTAPRKKREGLLPKEDDGDGHAFKCTEMGCTKAFKYNKNLLAHVRNDHSEDGMGPQFACPYCEAQFRYCGTRNRHIRQFHSKEKAQKAQEELEELTKFLL
ncbi:hypothetical protein BC830DRAFT_470232 [Chytriomyces sp. MP71]|nr:hypothetical protein BC830DRAFT_470232 [Chytriomyces sp. MP71]